MTTNNQNLHQIQFIKFFCLFFATKISKFVLPQTTNTFDIKKNYSIITFPFLPKIYFLSLYDTRHLSNTSLPHCSVS